MQRAKGLLLFGKIVIQELGARERLVEKCLC